MLIDGGPLITANVWAPCKQFTVIATSANQKQNICLCGFGSRPRKSWNFLGARRLEFEEQRNVCYY